MTTLSDQLKRLEQLVIGSRMPQDEPKTDEEWISLIREVDRAFNGGFCHNYKRPKYSDEDKEQIRALRSHVLKLVEECG